MTPDDGNGLNCVALRLVSLLLQVWSCAPSGSTPKAEFKHQGAEILRVHFAGYATPSYCMHKLLSDAPQL